MEKARITLYDVEKCGYYPRGANTPAFGNLNDTLEQLKKWSSNLNLSLTKISEPSDNSTPIYVLDLLKHEKDWLLALWNEVPSSNGNVSSITKNSPVGNPTIHKNKIEENSIPGYPTYFWISPEENSIATIKIHRKPAGRAGLNDYIYQFLSTKTRYVIEQNESEKGSTKHTIIGYTDRGDGIPTNSKPRFEIKQIKSDKNRELVISNPDMIKKIIRTTRVSVEDSVKTNFFQRVVGFLQNAKYEKEICECIDCSIRIELQYTPTENELRLMIDSNDQDPGRWNDLGFEVEGRSDIIWMNKSKVKTDFQIESIDEESGIANTTELLKELSSMRKEIFGN